MQFRSCSFPTLSSCSEVRVRNSLVLHIGLVLRTARARHSRPDFAGVHLERHLDQIDSCHSHRGCSVTHRRSVLQWSGCGVAHRWRWRDALHHRSWRVITAGMEKCFPRQERARRSLPLALERCTPPEELARHKLQEQEQCILRQGLARHSLSPEQRRCTLPHVLARHTLQEHVFDDWR